MASAGRTRGAADRRNGTGDRGTGHSRPHSLLITSWGSTDVLATGEAGRDGPHRTGHPPPQGKQGRVAARTGRELALPDSPCLRGVDGSRSDRHAWSDDQEQAPFRTAGQLPSAANARSSKRSTSWG
jgi:hypothetical protein